MPRQKIRTAKDCFLLLLTLLVAASLANASDVPDAAINPVSGAIEVTDAVLATGDYQIRYAVKPGDGGTTATALLTDNTASDLSPRIDIKDNGDTWVVWWRDAETPEVLCRVRDLATGTWSDETRISGEGESSRHPAITHDGSTTWIAYETNATSGTLIKCAFTNDGPEPFPDATVIAATVFSGDPSALIQSESGHVWVTWIDSATEVKWSEYDKPTGEWSAPQSESYEGSNVDAARKHIRLNILG